MDSLSHDAWIALLSARAPDKVKADLTPIELAALPDDDPVRIAAEAPKAEAPEAEGTTPQTALDDTARQRLRELGRLAWAQD
jgi:hypothetical protein